MITSASFFHKTPNLLLDVTHSEIPKIILHFLMRLIEYGVYYIKPIFMIASSALLPGKMNGEIKILVMAPRLIFIIVGKGWKHDGSCWMIRD